MKYFNLLLLAIVSISIVACTTYSDEEMSDFDKKIAKYLNKEGTECKKSDSGLYYKIIEEGEGDLIQYKDVVTFTYTGKLLNGEIFDHQKEPVEFSVDKLIGAWKEIMLLTKKGSTVFLAAPPQLGYGDNKLDDIPANSVLIYEMEILGVE